MMSSLEQIIKSMYIEPEFLELMGDEQKEVLFRMIREEQVRRWEKKERELYRAPSPKRSPKKIKFLNGADEKPWVWVMGEHKDDLPYDKLVQQREKEKKEQERRSEIIEAENLAKQELSLIQGLESFSMSEKRETGLHEAAGSESPELGIIRTESQIDNTRRGANTGSSMAIAASVRSATTEQQHVERALGTLQRSRSIAKKRAQELQQKMERSWKESQRRANMFERSRKRSFVAARNLTASMPNIHEKILEDLRKKEIEQATKKPTRMAPYPPEKRKILRRSSFAQEDSAPKSAVHALKWFNTVEAPKGVGKERDGTISVWFHGKLGREAASKVLEIESLGSFLVRLSAKMWGYTVSVKTHAGSRHFLVDASTGQYSFLGPKQQKFKTLTRLLEYYKTNPVTWEGQEFLLVPVGLEDDQDFYGGLYSEESDDDDSSTL